MSAAARSWPALLCLLVTVLLVAGCGAPGAAGSGAGLTTPATRPGTRTTCPEAVPTLPGDLQLLDRELVPFSRTLLAVHTTWAPTEGTRTLEVRSGGFIDDLTESYDDVTTVRDRVVRGQPVSVLRGSLLTSSVQLVFWREPGVAAPCDVHAVIGTNLSDAGFDAVIDHVGLRPGRQGAAPASPAGTSR